MELKEADWELEEALEDCLNCTFMELKVRNKLLVGIRWYSLNCTFMELKGLKSCCKFP